MVFKYLERKIEDINVFNYDKPSIHAARPIINGSSFLKEKSKNSI